MPIRNNIKPKKITLIGLSEFEKIFSMANSLSLLDHSTITKNTTNIIVKVAYFNSGIIKGLTNLSEYIILCM